MDVTKPCKFIGFGAMDVTRPCKFIGLGAMDVTKPYEFIRFGASDLLGNLRVRSNVPTTAAKMPTNSPLSVQTTPMIGDH